LIVVRTSNVERVERKAPERKKLPDHADKRRLLSCQGARNAHTSPSCNYLQ